MRRVHARHWWLLPTTAVVFVLLAIGAAFDSLPWDKPITEFVVDLRTPWLDRVVRRISWMGSTKVVFPVAAIAAAVSWRRCPRLAIAIVVIALARPLAEFTLKELVARDRPPVASRMVHGAGHSFPSGHPLATAASWGVLPLVVALYTKRRLVWWAVAISVWVLAVLIGMSRVWLGVHWASDVVGALLLASLGVAAAERFVEATHGPYPPCNDQANGQGSSENLTTSTRT
jgi:undecaprenyl-diphosphatase